MENGLTNGLNGPSLLKDDARKRDDATRGLQATQSPAPAEKRKRTKGEVAFDWMVYAGGAWVLNEIISAWVGNKVRAASVILPGEKFPSGVPEVIREKGAWWEGSQGVSRTLQSWLNPVKSSKELGPRVNGWIDRGWAVFLLCTGGNLLLVPIKLVEDQKSKIVRWFDRKFYGSKSDSDPALQKAHAEMDKTERQSWGSVVKARIAALAVAIGGDAVFADTDAYSTRLFKNAKFNELANGTKVAISEGSKLSHLASLNRIGVTLTRKVLYALRPNMRHTIDAAWKISPYAITTSEGTLATFGVLMTYLTTLSGAVAFSFYGFTRLFASSRDKKQSANLAAFSPSPENMVAAPSTYTSQQDPKSTDDKPRLTVSHVSRDAALLTQANQLGAN